VTNILSFPIRRRRRRADQFGMSEVLKALRLAGRAFGDAEAQRSRRDFEQGLAIKIATIRHALVGAGMDDESLLRAFEGAADAAWHKRQERQPGRLKLPDG
jgi:hypothetical protein